MATRKFSTNPTPVRIVYASPDGRVKVERHAPREFLLLTDDRPAGFYEFAYQAEQAGLVWLEEQAGQLAADLADEAADAVEVAPEFEGDDLLYTDFRCGDVSVGVSENAAAMSYGDEISEADLPTLRKLRAILNHPTFTALIGVSIPIVHERTFYGDNPTPQGIEYTVQTSDGDVALYVSHSDYPHIELFTDVLASVKLSHIEAILPALVALVSDPRVQAARVRKEAGLAQRAA